MRKQITEYVLRNFGNFVVCSEPLKSSDGLWHTSLNVNYGLKMDDGEDYVISFNGLGELVFDKSFKLVKGTTRTELLTTLNKVIEKLVTMHTNHVSENFVESEPTGLQPTQSQFGTRPENAEY